MKNIEVVRYKKQLDELFNKISALSEDLELQSHWSRYLCIRISGFLEVSVRAIYSQYAKDKAAPYVANYVQSQLKNFQNPNMEKIIQLTGFFDREWADTLKRDTEGELKDAIVSIVAVRNDIAHGGSGDITYVRIKDYYKRVVKVVELIEKQCNGE